MSAIKSLKEETNGMSLKYKAKTIFSPNTWKRIRRHRKQRIERGISDQDMWNSGEHIMGLISQSMKYHETKGVSDFKYMLKFWKEEGTDFGYKTLKQVYTDIDNYLAWDRAEWTEGLSSKMVSEYIENPDDEPAPFSVAWYDDENGLKLTDAKVKRLMDASNAKGKKLHDKAVNALTFWSRHAIEFWD